MFSVSRRAPGADQPKTGREPFPHPSTLRAEGGTLIAPQGETYATEYGERYSTAGAQGA